MMVKPSQQREIVLTIDRDTGVLDLRVFAHHPKRHRTQTVGTATLTMADLREVVPMLTERLQIEDQLVKAESTTRKSKKGKAKNP